MIGAWQGVDRGGGSLAAVAATRNDGRT